MMTLTHCPICSFHKFTQNQIGNHDMMSFECERCGKFTVSDDFLHGFKDIRTRYGEIGFILSGLAREIFETRGEPPVFLSRDIAETLKHHLIPDIQSIEEKIQKFLQRLREKTEYFGQEIEYGDIETIVPLAYARNIKELEALFKLIDEKKLARIRIGVLDQNRTATISLLADGWEFTNTHKGKNKESDRAFIAVWFDDSMNENINAIEAAVADCNFKPVCIRNEHFAGKIIDKVLGEIRRSRFVVVDLTGNRSSVFFEAGFAFGLGLETIYIHHGPESRVSSSLEFYVRHFQCYFYKNSEDLREILRNAINARIKK